MSRDVNPHERYARHLAMPRIGEAGQAKLAAGRVLVAGAGGLGSPAAFYLAAAGVGTIALMDGDQVEPSNLQRQILHFTADVGRPKVESAAEKLLALNPDVKVEACAERLTRKNAPAILKGFDFVIDATDTFASKLLLAEVCHAAGKPYSHAGIQEFAGQTITVLPGKTACYRCVFPSPPDLEGTPRGPLGAVPGVIGAIQATEAIKFLLGIGDLLADRLLTYDALSMDFRCFDVKRDPKCPLCGE